MPLLSDRALGCEEGPPTLARHLGAGGALWPDGARFALFLSHDVDQAYDRELFGLIGEANHLRRVWFCGKPGSRTQGLGRIARGLVRPRPPGQAIDEILSIDGGLGFRSTFFLLEDGTFSHLGGRYRYSDPAVRRIASSIVDAGCEMAVHGAYHNADDSGRYWPRSRSLRGAFGREPVGARNHYLRRAPAQVGHSVSPRTNALLSPPSAHGAACPITHSLHPAVRRPLKGCPRTFGWGTCTFPRPGGGGPQHGVPPRRSRWLRVPGVRFAREAAFKSGR